MSIIRQDATTRDWVIMAPSRGHRPHEVAPTQKARPSSPYSQLIAIPVAPMQMRRKYAVAMRHYDDTGRCLYCDLVQAEIQAGLRVVLETQHFVVLHPFASRVPFETWIMPTRHQASFGQVSAEDLIALARVLRATLRALYDILGDPDFNAIVQTAPLEDEAKPYYLWHLQIVPRASTLAGFELGSGMAITTMMPEASAAVMREVMTPTGTEGP